MLFIIIIIVFKRISVEYEIHRIFYSFIIVSNTFHVAVNALDAAAAAVATIYIPGERRTYRRQHVQKRANSPQWNPFIIAFRELFYVLFTVL